MTIATPDGWITTTEAAQRLGVKRATLYAYVSRGLLRSQRRPGQQESLFDRAQIDAIASASRPSGSPHPVLRFRSIATAVSSQLDGDLLYRGVPLTDVVALGSSRGLRSSSWDIGDAPSLARSGGRDDPGGHRSDRRTLPSSLHATTLPRSLPPLASSVVRLPLGRRLPVAVQLLAVADPLAGDIDPERVRTTALSLVPATLSLAAGTFPATRHTPEEGDLARDLLRAVGGREGSPAELAVARVLLVALLDHGLTASTVAARVAASTRAGLHDCLAAAYAAMPGGSTARPRSPPTHCWSRDSTLPRRSGAWC